MSWNWQHPDWPRFRFDARRIEEAETSFLRHGGILIGALKHLTPDDETELVAETATSEALTTSAIEGEKLDRQSVRSSILRELGLQVDRRAGPREQGVARLMVNLLRRGTDKLSHQTLWDWHEMLMLDRSDLSAVGAYRSHPEPMRIVSGRWGRESVHFEAPPSERVREEMDRFVLWFNDSRGDLAPLARSGIAHLYFESIHPFEDGNGRIGRAIAEVALAQGLGQSSLVMLSTEIESRHSAYYQELERASKGLEITDWLAWFSDLVLNAQLRTLSWVDFVIAKTRLLDRIREKINPRQERALLRIFREGPEGFQGGLSSGNYQTITGASPATAGRDLADLVGLGALSRTGVGKGARYWLVVGRADQR